MAFSGHHVSTILLVAALASGVAANRLKYITSVTNTCPETEAEPAVVTVLTDMIETTPYALCQGGENYDFENVNKATWKLTVYITGDPTAVCVMNKRESSSIYVINVYVPLTGGILYGQETPHVVTCTYESHKEYESLQSAISDSKRPLKGQIENAGSEGQSTIDLYLADVKGRRLTGRTRIGRTVKLMAELQGDIPEEVGFQVLECQAIGRFNNYHILIGGCGDGMVLQKSDGFSTSGRVTVSPFFRTFRLIGTSRLVFKCTFILCTNNCDGNSCDYVRSFNGTVSADSA